MKARYVPRDSCAEPAAFGKALRLRWLPPQDELAEVRTRAAQLQNLYAVRIRHAAAEADVPNKARANNALQSLDHKSRRKALAALRAKDLEAALAFFPSNDRVAAGRTLVGLEMTPALERLAAKMGTSHARLMGCLRGENVMRLDDLAWADLFLGGISEMARSQKTAPGGTAPRSQR